MSYLTSRHGTSAIQPVTKMLHQFYKIELRHEFDCYFARYFMNHYCFQQSGQNSGEISRNTVSYHSINKVRPVRYGMFGTFF